MPPPNIGPTLGQLNTAYLGLIISIFSLWVKENRNDCSVGSSLAPTPFQTWGENPPKTTSNYVLMIIIVLGILSHNLWNLSIENPLSLALYSNFNYLIF